MVFQVARRDAHPTFRLELPTFAIAVGDPERAEVARVFGIGIYQVNPVTLGSLGYSASPSPCPLPPDCSPLQPENAANNMTTRQQVRMNVRPMVLMRR